MAGVGRRAAAALITGTVALVGVAGCGNSRAPVASLSTPAAPKGFHALGFPRYGVALLAPKNWIEIDQPAPIVAVVASAQAFVTLFRYPRTGPPPVGAAELDQARDALVAAARAKDPGLVVIAAGTRTIDHHGAVELDAYETINGQRRRVRSTHIYTASAEFVLDEYAPLDEFHAVDHSVFSPMAHSLKLGLHRRSRASA